VDKDRLSNSRMVYSDIEASESTDLKVSDRSPLWFLGEAPHLEEFVRYLQHIKDQIEQSPEVVVQVKLSGNLLGRVREDFAAMIKAGEEKLHRLGLLMSKTLLTTFHLHSVVIGEMASTKERFTLSQTVAPETLFSTIDLDLGNLQLSKLLFFDGSVWSKPSLVSNVVEYVATEPNEFGIHRVLTRVKAEQEIWNKVVDEIFQVDQLVKMDKKLVHLSRFIKDVFGLKIVVGSTDEARKVHDCLKHITWSHLNLTSLGLISDEKVERLKFIETKEHLDGGHKKASGWQAVKSVVRWADSTFEIQVQPLRNYLAEKERLTGESHVGFKARREALRDELAERFPLFRFYRELLRWLFLAEMGENSLQPPQFHNISIIVES